MMSFFNYAVQRRLGKGHQLLKIEAIINWEPIKEKLSRIYKNEYKEGYKGIAGVKPYSSLSMFKAILLQAWHSLSDPKLEEALKVRIDFMLFTGLGLENDSPDETTICRFRQRLIQNGLDQKLFQEINKQLEGRGLKIEKATGAVIDATVIESAARPKRCIEEIAIDRHEDQDIEIEEEEDNQVLIRESVDPDAKWLKKGKRSYFGYKLFMATDEKDGYITSIDVTPANKSEVGHFKYFIKKIPRKKKMRIYGDKGYASKENRELLKGEGLKDGLMEKGTKGKKLIFWKKIKNRLISRRRFIVEQGYGTLKRILRFQRANYIGIEKVTGEAFRKVTCFNLIKAVNMIKVNDWIPRDWCVQNQLIE